MSTSATGNALSQDQLVDELERVSGYRFCDRSVAAAALTHRSYGEGRPTGIADNQRLEFLGDAVLRLVVSEEAYRRWPEMDEGMLSLVVSRVVSGRSLARAARNRGLGRLVRLGRGQEAAGGRENESILAGVFEACLGAVYLDGGLTAAASMVVSSLGAALDRAAAAAGQRDYKSALQERAQGVAKVIPRYEVVSLSGPPHQRVFRVAVSLTGDALAVGEGPSKRAAEQDAARRLLEWWGVDSTARAADGREGRLTSPGEGRGCDDADRQPGQRRETP